MRKRIRCSSGAAITLRDQLTSRRQRPRKAAYAADMAAIDQGELLVAADPHIRAGHRGSDPAVPRSARSLTARWRRPVRARGLLEQLGPGVIASQTSGGLLEFAVRRPDVDLVLNFLDREAKQGPMCCPDEDAQDDHAGRRGSLRAELSAISGSRHRSSLTINVGGQHCVGAPTIAIASRFPDRPSGANAAM